MRVISYEAPSLICPVDVPARNLHLKPHPPRAPFTRTRSRSSCFGHFVSHQTEISVTVSPRSTYHYPWSNATQISLMHHYHPIFISKPRKVTTILHQPLVSRFSVIFPLFP